MAGTRVLQARLVSGGDDTKLSPELERRGVERLRWMVLAVGVGFLASIPLRHLTWGKDAPLLTLSEIVAGTFAGLSLLFFLALRFGGLPKSFALKTGLAYEVLLCFAVALVEQVLVGFSPMPFRVSLVAIVLLTFPLVVPSAPRWRLLATIVAASAHPLALLVVDRATDGAIRTVELVGTAAPTFIVAGISTWLGHIAHRLRVEAGRGLTFGQYELVRKLGEGGMGEVWEARHAQLLRPAAIKIIRPDAAATRGESARARFRREAQATGALGSPHTVELYDFGTTDDGTLYYAMEYLEGIDLETFVQRFGRMHPARVLFVIGQVAESLAEAHELGLVHRDIKPANIFLCRVGISYDYVKVLDFGLVKPRYVADNAPVSVVGAVSGTPGYVAPEHAAGKEFDGRADLYSLGCVAYYLATGKRVFERPTRMALLSAHLTEDPEPLSRRAGHPIPDVVDRLVLDLLQRDPQKRPESARALLGRIVQARAALDLQWTDDIAQDWWDKHLEDLAKTKHELVL
jgi:hypothetical protein